jgi:hypothetical protein
MKKIIAIAIGSFLAGNVLAQQNLKPAPTMPGAAAKAAKPAAARPAAAAKVRKTAIGGTILTARREAVAKIQAYIYSNDTIKASGFSDASGNYETSSVLPGVYTLRLVYPRSGRRITVSGVPVKALKVTTVNYTGIEPFADSTFTYNELMPAAPAAKK